MSGWRDEFRGFDTSMKEQLEISMNSLAIKFGWKSFDEMGRDEFVNFINELTVMLYGQPTIQLKDMPPERWILLIKEGWSPILAFPLLNHGSFPLLNHGSKSLDAGASSFYVNIAGGVQSIKKVISGESLASTTSLGKDNYHYYLSEVPPYFTNWINENPFEVKQ